MFIILQTLCNAFDKSLRTAYFFLRGMFSFKCSLVRIFEETNISVPLQQRKNALSSSIKV